MPPTRYRSSPFEDYVNSRYILNPLRLWDCDRPVNASAAYLFATAERARDMRQSPVYVLHHSQHNFRKRSTQEDLDEIEDWTDRAARRMYEGAGLGANDVDLFNPYDGYARRGRLSSSLPDLTGAPSAG